MHQHHNNPLALQLSNIIVYSLAKEDMRGILLNCSLNCAMWVVEYSISQSLRTTVLALVGVLPVKYESSVRCLSTAPWSKLLNFDIFDYVKKFVATEFWN